MNWRRGGGACVCLLCGLPGAGKSAVAAGLRTRFSDSAGSAAPRHNARHNATDARNAQALPAGAHPAPAARQLRTSVAAGGTGGGGCAGAASSDRTKAGNTARPARGAGAGAGAGTAAGIVVAGVSALDIAGDFGDVDCRVISVDAWMERLLGDTGRDTGTVNQADAVASRDAWHQARVHAEAEADTLLAQWRRSCCQSNVCERTPKSSRSRHHHLLLVDDNFHLASMRRQFMKVARKHSASFCQVFVDVPFAVAAARNAARGQHAIPVATLRKIAASMQQEGDAGGSSNHRWARGRTFRVSNTGPLSETVRGLLTCLRAESIVPMLRPPTAAATPAHIEPRQIQRWIHDADLCMRKIIGCMMATAHVRGGTGGTDISPGSGGRMRPSAGAEVLRLLPTSVDASSARRGLAHLWRGTSAPARYADAHVYDTALAWLVMPPSTATCHAKQRLPKYAARALAAALATCRARALEVLREWAHAQDGLLDGSCVATPVISGSLDTAVRSSQRSSGPTPAPHSPDAMAPAPASPDAPEAMAEDRTATRAADESEACAPAHGPATPPPMAPAAAFAAFVCEIGLCDDVTPAGEWIVPSVLRRNTSVRLKNAVVHHQAGASDGDCVPVRVCLSQVCHHHGGQ